MKIEHYFYTIIFPSVLFISFHELLYISSYFYMYYSLTDSTVSLFLLIL